MILIDSRVGSKELVPYLQKLQVPVQLAQMEYGDACMEGSGPTGTIAIGVERKALHDMLHCVDDSRYSAHQLPGMRQLYSISYLIIEGVWRPHDPLGTLMEGYEGGKWRECRYRTQRVMYHKLRRYLFSVGLAGVQVLYTRDIAHTAFDISELFHYFQKPWQQHRALLETQKLNIPTLRGKPTLTRLWATSIDDVGVVLGQDAERLFKTPLALALASEEEWQQLKGVGPRTAQKIVKQVRGAKR